VAWIVGPILLVLVVLIGLAILGAFVKAPTKTAAGAKHHRTTGGAHPKTHPTPPPPPLGPPKANVVVSNVGFAKSVGDIDYGLTLTNKSERADATNLTVTVRAADARGRSVASDTNQISVIPAGHSFNLAGLMSPSVSLDVTKLRVAVHGVRSLPRDRFRRLPLVTDVKVRKEYGGFAQVSANLTNRSFGPLSQDAPIYIVYFNSSGRIIDSAYDTTGATVRPHASVLFHSIEPYGPSKRPAYARLSVDACTFVQCYG
jgi:hypothetical protein